MKTEELSPYEFLGRFDTMEKCRDYIFRQKYPAGFSCRRCQHSECWMLKHRGGSWQCKACNHQESAKVGTLLEGSQVPLVKWFRAIYEITVTVGGIAASELQRKIEVGSYETAWHLLHKLRCAMGLRDEGYQLSESIELDGAVFGRRATGTQCKVYIAIESRQNRKGLPCAGFAKAQVTASFCKENIKKFTTRQVEPLTVVKTDAGPEVEGVEDDTDLVLHSEVMKGNKAKLDKHLPWVHKMISNMKATIVGTFHGVSMRYLQLYLDEYLYRFNRRWCRGQTQLRLINACLAVQPLAGT